MLAEWQNQLGRVLLWPTDGQDASLQRDSQVSGLEKLSLYQELMHNTVRDTLESIYPYSYQLLSQNGQDAEAWIALAEVYRRAYPNGSYKLLGAVEHFPQFLSEQAEWLARYPFLSELALYEWLDMQVLNLPANHSSSMSLPAALPDLSKFQAFSPVWNQAYILHHFEFHLPGIVEALQAESSDMEALNLALGSEHVAQPVDMLLYRDIQTLQVRFFCVNGMTALLIQLSNAQPEMSYVQLLEQLQDLVPPLREISYEVLLKQAGLLFKECLGMGMLLGSNALKPDEIGANSR